ncbi:hypothetical protein GCM10010965_28910 [Caldalkalibacillus thermarum]|uniref:hypothetical protein n=1 Tax=Caldalkalibacillus thermarum TaxID=296745 RepID=UPI00166403FA|nr:hypothetical protein [Caldalkalibacillus thermarum]GGK34201.1 hypothetical protein GCM10010965_28910 [Caldalkalibacillus thermarum]
MIALIRPTIAVLLGVLAYQFFVTGWEGVGMVQTVFLTGASFLLLEKWNIHPAYVILGALV